MKFVDLSIKTNPRMFISQKWKWEVDLYPMYVEELVHLPLFCSATPKGFSVQILVMYFSFPDLKVINCSTQAQLQISRA